jgi:hypothetical protein
VCARFDAVGDVVLWEKEIGVGVGRAPQPPHAPVELPPAPWAHVMKSVKSTKSSYRRSNVYYPVRFTASMAAETDAWAALRAREARPPAALEGPKRPCFIIGEIF